MVISKRLIRAMQRLGKTKKDQAVALEMNPKQITRWENGNIPRVIIKLERTGIIRIVDEN